MQGTPNRMCYNLSLDLMNAWGEKITIFKSSIVSDTLLNPLNNCAICSVVVKIWRYAKIYVLHEVGEVSLNKK